MADRPLSFCRTPGCGELTRRGWCEKCYQERHKGTTKNAPGDPFYSSAPWRKLRQLVFSKNPLCVKCKAKGVVKPATDVDHVLDRKDRPDLELVESNLQPLCHECHSSKTASKHFRRRKPKRKGPKRR